MYPADFLIGTSEMNNSQIGTYIRLLCWMHQKGPLTSEQIKTLVGDVDDIVMAKFKKRNGKYINVRLLEEMDKYGRYVDGRLKNLKGGKKSSSKKNPHMDSHMGSHMDSDSDSDNILAKKLLAREFEAIWLEYPNKDGKKDALRHFMNTVKTPEDIALINKALKIYKGSAPVSRGFVKKGSTWFNNWQDWVEDPTKDSLSAKIEQLGAKHGLKRHTSTK